MSPNELLKIIHQLAQHYKRFPKIAEITNQTGIPEYKVKAALKGLVAKGLLTQRGNWYRFPSEAVDLQAYNRVHATVTPDPEVDAIAALKEFAASTPLDAETVKASAKALTDMKPGPLHRPDPISTHREWFVITIRIVMGLIGVGAIILSAYYTSLWAKDFLPIFWAAILSGVVVAFSAFAFEVAVMYFRERKRMAGLAFFLLWFVGITYSISTTIAGQYNAFAVTERAAAVSRSLQAADTQVLATYRQQELDADTGAKNTSTKLETMYAIMKDAGQSADKRFEFKNTWKDTMDAITRMEGELKQYQADRKAAQDHIASALRASPDLAKADQVDGIPDFYQWMAGILKVSRNMAQFIMGLFPAIFIDFLAPAALTVALFFTPAGTRIGRRNLLEMAWKRFFKK